MFDSTVLEVVIGLCFCFGAVSLLASAINEAIASALRLRANALLQGVKDLLNDPQFEGLARALYNHALISPRDAGAAASEADLRNRPSYIPSKDFAVALIESIERVPGDFARLGDAIEAMPDGQLRRLLQGMYRRAGDDAAQLHEALAAWFDNGMARVSGAYKRQSQLISFLIALLLAACLNLDAFHLFTSLWQHPSLVAALPVTHSPAQAAEALQALRQLPVGWGRMPSDFAAALLMFAGWLVTASSALFGSPFWFDLLQHLVRLRGSGKPQ